MSPTHQDLSNDTTFSQIKSRVPVPLKSVIQEESTYPRHNGEVIRQNDLIEVLNAFTLIVGDYGASRRLHSQCQASFLFTYTYIERTYICTWGVII